MKTSSWGLEAFTRFSAAAATRLFLSRMLPLLSIIMPSETGMSSRRKILSGCSMPFSSTLKAGCCRLVTSFPLLSTTLACTTTSRVSAVKTGTSSCGAEPFCAAGVDGNGDGGLERLGGAPWPNAQAADSTKAAAILLRGSIISGTKHGPQLRQSRGLYQFHL